MLSPFSYAQAKNLSAVSDAAASFTSLCIRMKLAPVIGQLSSPAWSTSIR